MSNGQAATNAMMGLVPLVVAMKVVEEVNKGPRRNTKPMKHIGLMSAAKRL